MATQEAAVEEELEQKTDATPTDNGAGQTPEESHEPKAFSEMTEEEKAALPPEELVRLLEEEEGKEEEKPESEEKSEEEKPKEEEPEAGKTIEEKLKSGEELTFEELEKATSEQRGRYYSFKEVREKNRRLEQELDKERAVKEAQLKIIENMRKAEEPKPQVFQTEYEKVAAQIDAVAQKHEQEFGEPYKLTWQDQRALDQARAVDQQTFQQKQAEEAKVREQQASMQTFQSRLDDGIVKVKQEGMEDWDSFYANIGEKLINPEKSANPKLAMANARHLIECTLADPNFNAAKYIRDVLALSTPEGQQYFRDKEQKKINQSLLEKGKLKTTQTSASAEAIRSTAGKQKVTINELSEKTEYWKTKLSEEQFMKVAMGGEVFV